MRWIQKQPGQPPCIEDFVAVQTAARPPEPDGWQQFRIDYGSFTRGPELLRLLIDEQRGLCAYTGAAVDAERLATRRPRNAIPPRHDYWFKAHIEHLKSQQQCRAELSAGGGMVGRDRGEDISYHNVVTAIEVGGTRAEHFGASVRGDSPVPIWPTTQASETSFEFFLDGTIRGRASLAADTVAVLRLDHPTLNDWRAKEIDDWFALPDSETLPDNQGYDAEADTLPRPEDLSFERLNEIISAMETPVNGKLPEFSFVIAQIARDGLALKQLRAAANPN